MWFKVAFFALCTAGLAAFYFRGGSRFPLTTSMTTPISEAPKAGATADSVGGKRGVTAEAMATKPKADAGPTAKTGPRKLVTRPQSASGVENTPLEQSAAATPIAAVPPPPPFPLAEAIPRGAAEETVREEYGDPDVATLTSTGGRLVTNYIYARERGRNATVIRFVDGKVAQAYQKRVPLPPPGASTVQLWRTRAPAAAEVQTRRAGK